MINFMFGAMFGVTVTILAIKYLCDITFETRDNMVISFEPDDEDKEDN